MDKQQQHKQYSAEDFQRYNEGAMSLPERHALEKAALEDPFLADALEGYVYTSNAATDATELRKRLAIRIEKETKVIPVFKRDRFNWLRIAAMLVVLLGAGWGVYELSKGEKEDIALNEAKTKTAIKNDTSELMAAPAESISDGADKKLTGADIEQENILNNLPATQTNPTPNQRPATSGSISRSKKIADVKNKEEVETADVSSALAASAATDSSVGLMSFEVTGKPAPVKVFKGRVVDVTGAPLPYVTISSAKDKVATTTDLNGYFSIQSADTTLKATVSLVGFEVAQTALNAPSQNTVVLKEASSSLNEVVVVGYGSKRKRAFRKQIVESGELEPTEGWQRFDEYITNNLKVPDDVKEKPLSGEVALSFDVDKVGEPVNIKVDQSLCTGCDEEAVRLLKEGPKWKKKKGKRGKVKIKF